VHHVALISSSVERTIQFFDGLLGFPLIEMFENRDYAGSTHFFFDLGHGNTLAYFDLPGLPLEPYQEVLGGHHHLAISIERHSGRPPASGSPRPAWKPRTWTGRRCTSAAPTANASN
jgi:catechol 2,3-dioxygenase-like lactoylglutathione lyase family enzyme